MNLHVNSSLESLNIVAYNYVIFFLNLDVRKLKKNSMANQSSS